MTVLIVGGASSGKSAYGEALISRLAQGRRKIYLATMAAEDLESQRRIARHRLSRRGKGFWTVECPVDLASAPVPEGGGVLLECLGNLCANELYTARNPGAEENIFRGFLRLRSRCEQTVIVSNEVFTGGSDYAGNTLAFLRLLANLNRRIAALADGVCEVCCGVPVYYKGGDLFGHL